MHRIYMGVSAALTAILVLLNFSCARHNEKVTPQARATTTSAARTDTNTGTKPGGYIATLTVPDQQPIQLDSTTNKSPIRGVAEARQLEPGTLSYLPPDQHFKHERVTGKPTAFHVLTVPRGGTYKLILPDGTKVYLNSATSLRYPVHFSGPDRVVELTGEANFIVAHDPSKPFRVITKFQVVEALKTQFVISAYETEGFQTVLLNGEVRVTGETNKTVLNSGQELEINGAGKWTVRKVMNPEGAIAWTRGMFDFQDLPLSVVLRSLGRWYDLDVDMSAVRIDPPRTLRMASRNQPLENFLSSLELGEVHLRIEGKKIIVFP